jgi:hypothetical protein
MTQFMLLGLIRYYLITLIVIQSVNNPANFINLAAQFLFHEYKSF